MKNTYRLFIMSLLLAACAPERPEPAPLPATDTQAKSKPADAGRARASFYGDEFHGKRTASGETFDKNELTAAHRSYPFGTRLRVTNPANGKTVVVRVNDRGPYKKGRQLDLSEGAAEALNVDEKGVANLKVEKIK